MQTILITGGTGLVGNRMSLLLENKGYRVIHLSRTRNLDARFPAFYWDINKQEIDEDAITQADYIVHLAGANVAGGIWTKKRKQVIIDSRVKSAELIQKVIKETGHQPKAIICASASGYYADLGDKVLDENSKKGNGFLSEVVEKWEAANDGFHNLGIRTVKLRIGIVLSTKGGALEKMLPSYKVRVGTYFGSGNQYYSWIHLDDLCEMFIYSMENEQVEGVYNAASRNPVTNKELVEKIGEVLNKSVLIMPAPAFAMRLVMGEMADIVLDGARLSPAKIGLTGYRALYDYVEDALRNVIEHKI
jgi:uncharacterized protein (TIGR01777 family)